MTSRSRRKRPITAPNTRRATITSRSDNRLGRAEWRHAAWAAIALVAGLALASTTLAGETQDQSPPASKLKWQARRSPQKRAAESPEIASPALVPAQHVAAEELPRPLSTRSSRAKLRDSIMQVQSGKADPFKDPFADEDRAKNADLQTSPPAQPEGARPERPRPRDEPAPLPSSGDPFPEEPIPSPPTNEAPLPEGLFAPTEGTSCEDQTADCNQLVRDLRERDITSILVAVDVSGVEGQDFPCECKLRDLPFAGRSWSPTTFTWKATGVCHKPLYFEDVQLERYGHSWNPVVQPFMSAAHFFVSVPLLPYKMGLNPPNECMYTLGYYRPGSCAPYVIEPIPLSLRGALFEAAGVTGFVFWFWPPAG